MKPQEIFKAAAVAMIVIVLLLVLCSENTPLWPSGLRENFDAVSNMQSTKTRTVKDSL